MAAAGGLHQGVEGNFREIFQHPGNHLRLPSLAEGDETPNKTQISGTHSLLLPRVQEEPILIKEARARSKDDLISEYAARVAQIHELNRQPIGKHQKREATRTDQPTKRKVS